MWKKKEELVYLLKNALKIEEKRTSLQNRALHLLFTNIAEQLNNIGMDFNKEIQDIVFSMPYTGLIFKTEIWKPLQKTLFGIDSTTELTTKQINTILDVLIMTFGNSGVEVVFPNKFDKIIEDMNNDNKL